MTLCARAGWMKEWWGWIVCAASFIVHIGIYPLGYCYSLLFIDIQREFNATTVEIGGIGSVIWGVQMFSSPIGTCLEYWFSYRTVFVCIIVLSSIWIFLGSFCQSIYYLYLTIGVGYGLSLGISWFILLCVFAQHFPAENNVRAISVSYLGATTAMLVASEPITFMLAAVGWRTTLQYLAAFTLIIALPPAFLISPPTITNKEKIKEKETCTTDMLAVHKTSDTIETYEELSETKQPLYHEENKTDKIEVSVMNKKRRRDRWRLALSVDALFYGASTVACSMAWSVFYVNIVSFFDSVDLDSKHNSTLIMITAILDIVTKIILATAGDKLPLKKIYLFLIKLVAMMIVSLSMAYASTYPQLIILAIVIGIMRALFNVLLFPCAIETFGKSCPDETIAVIYVARGLGFMTGTIPAGAIYDSSGSYAKSFLLVAAVYFASVIFLSLIPIHQWAVRPSRSTTTDTAICGGTVESDVAFKMITDTHS